MRLRNTIAAICSLLIVLSLSVESVEARESYNLNGGWRLFASVEGRGDRARNIALPYSWSIEGSAPVSLTSTNFLRTLYLPDRYNNSRIYLKFNGVNSIANLYVNGEYVGEHRGGSAAFIFDITDQAKIGETNMILLRVSSVPRNDIMPTSVEHEMYGGVFRDVELIVTPQVAINPNVYGADGVFVTTRSVAGGVVKGDVKVHFVAPSPADRRVTLTITDQSGKEVFKDIHAKSSINPKNVMTLPFEVSGASLWSIDDPALYDVKVSLGSVESAGGSVLNQRDEVVVRTGFRTVAVAPDGRAKGIVRVNGVPTLMRGVSLYHDAPATVGVLSKKLHREQLEVVQDLGANSVRSAIMQHDKALYSLCDSLGVMAWVELPFTRSQYLSDAAYFATTEFEQNGVQQLREMIYQNYNHPSVVMWGIFSQISDRQSGVLDYAKKLNGESKRIDPLRPTVALSNKDGQINTITDLVAWRQNIGWDNGFLNDISLWSNQIHSPRWSHLRSAVMYGAPGSVDHQIDRSEIEKCREQRLDGWYPEVRQSEMHEAYAKHIASDSLFWGVWHTTLFDFKAPRAILGENVDGLVSFDREDKKDAYYLYRALWNSDSPTLHIADKRARMVGDGSSRITLRVYASGDEEPVARVNGVEHQMKKVAPAQFILEGVEVNRSTKVVVTQGKLSDSVEFIYDSPLRNQRR